MNKPKQYYRIIHDWLHKHYGKPNFCENKNCVGLGKRYEYALKIGFTHQRDINNYLRLCSKCHRNYDMTAEKAEVISNRVAGKFNHNLAFGPESCKKKVVLHPENLIFNSGKELADYLGCDKSSVYQVLSGKRKTIYGHKVSYAIN